MNREDAYLNWTKFDPSRKGVLQQEAYAAGWRAAIEHCTNVVKLSYIIDESEDIKKVILENLKEKPLVISQKDYDAYYRDYFKDAL